MVPIAHAHRNSRPLYLFGIKSKGNIFYGQQLILLEIFSNKNSSKRKNK
jgi:hypothetical protein